MVDNQVMVNYNQQLVNDSLTNTLDMAPMVTEKESKKPKRAYTKKAPTRGGARAGSGRPKGSTNKITLETLVQSLDKEIGMSFEERIARNYHDAIMRQDWHAVKDYDKAFLSKIVADKVETDITSNGHTLATAFSFPGQELDDWK
jgi:hypothetical protein